MKKFTAKPATMQHKPYPDSSGCGYPNLNECHKSLEKYNKHLASQLKFSAGNHAEFTLIFQAFYKQLCYFSNKLVNDWDSGEDIVVEVFIKLWNAKGEFANTGALKRWLYKCTYNKSLNYIQRAKRKNYSNTDILEKSNSLTDIVESERLEEIHLLITKLPPKCKNIMKLYYSVGLENNQIAKMLNVSVHTVKNQKARGVYLIKKRLTNIQFN